VRDPAFSAICIFFELFVVFEIFVCCRRRVHREWECGVEWMLLE
jgi:hypothetical protein